MQVICDIEFSIGMKHFCLTTMVIGYTKIYMIPKKQISDERFKFLETLAALFFFCSLTARSHFSLTTRDVQSLRGDLPAGHHLKDQHDG